MIFSKLNQVLFANNDVSTPVALLHKMHSYKNLIEIIYFHQND